MSFVRLEGPGKEFQAPLSLLPQPSETSYNIGDMTTRYTLDEWLAIIAQTQRNLPNTRVEYKAPNLGTLEFAKSIDHTLLKIDATKEQIDKLCDEARRHDFKVWQFDAPFRFPLSL